LSTDPALYKILEFNERSKIVRRANCEMARYTST